MQNWLDMTSHENSLYVVEPEELGLEDNNYFTRHLGLGNIVNYHLTTYTILIPCLQYFPYYDYLIYQSTFLWASSSF